MDKHLPTDYQQYIALSRYARWREDLNRRETWEETVDRYFNHVDKWVDQQCEKRDAGLKDWFYKDASNGGYED